MKFLNNKIFRVDIINRILVIITLILFSIIPSYELYFLNIETDTEKIMNLVNIIFLISLLGNGILAIYKPTRLSWFFFFDILFLLLFYNDAILNFEIRVKIGFDVFPLYLSEVIFASISLFVNLSYFIYFLGRKKKYKSEYNEYTNSDSFYDFLNGSDSNHKIDDELKEVDEKGNRVVKKIKKWQFSKVSRIVSYLFYVVVFIISLSKITRHVTPGDRIIDNILFYPLLSGIVISTILLISSLFFPRDFKYSYYFNLAIYLITLVFASRIIKFNPTLFIISLAILLLSFLITMITEGRTWMGARYDK